MDISNLEKYIVDKNLLCLDQTLAFSLNSFVEKHLSEESTIVYENFFPLDILNELKNIAREHLSLPDLNTINKTESFWYRKGSIHLNKRLEEISNNYIKPLLKIKDCFLIGDTAFCINHPPHDIHVDNRDFRTNIKNKKNVIGYKSVVIPLEIDTDDYPILFTCEQYFYGPTTRFVKGTEDIIFRLEENRKQKNSGVYFSYDYKKDGVKYLNNENKLTKKWYDKYIDYDINKPWAVTFSSFEGLSIEKENIWKPNNIIIFDSSRLHFGELISKRNATYKLGISLNYGIRINS